MRLLVLPPTALLALCLSCVQIESKSIHYPQHSPAAFSPGLNAHRISSQHRDSIPRIRHIDTTYKARRSVACQAAVLEPVIASTSLIQRILSHGVTTFMSNWKAYSVIPFIAGFVGWFTNYLAVQMIFYPIRWRGLPIYRVEGEPLGFLGCVFNMCCCSLLCSSALMRSAHLVDD
jgi:hypothetical protein